MPSPAIMIGALVCCCLVVLAVVLGVYFGNVASPAPAPGPASGPSPSAVQTILTGSQTLQDAEYVATAVKPVTFTPPAGPVNYTMAFWAKIDNHAGGWREIWRRGGNGPNPPPGPGWARVPAFYISGNDDANGPGHVHYVHGSTTNWNTLTYSSNFKATPGTWFHFAATVDSTTKKITAYVNGVLEPSKSAAEEITTGTFEWVNQDFFNLNPNDGVHIKKWYFIPSVLSASDIAKLAADAGSPSGTSTYVPEPYDDSSDAAVY